MTRDELQQAQEAARNAQAAVDAAVQVNAPAGELDALRSALAAATEACATAEKRFTFERLSSTTTALAKSWHENVQLEIELGAARTTVEKKARLDADLLGFSKKGKAAQLAALDFDHDRWDTHADDYFRRNRKGSAGDAARYVLDQLTLEGKNLPKFDTLRKRFSTAWKISRGLGVAGS